MHNIKSGCIMLFFSAVVCFCSASLLVSSDSGLTELGEASPTGRQQKVFKIRDTSSC